MRRLITLSLLVALPLLALALPSCQGAPRDILPVVSQDLAPAAYDFSFTPPPPPDLAATDADTGDGG